MTMAKLIRRLKIIEAIPRSSGQGQEKGILDEFLQMEEESYRPLAYDSFSVDNRCKDDNLKENFLNLLFTSYKQPKNKKIKKQIFFSYRYIHISAHGNGDSIFVGSGRRVKINSDDIHDYCDQDKLPLRGALITLSACGSLLGRFAEALADCGANAVIRPLNTVGFQESAMFFILFYFMLSRRTGMLKRYDEDDDAKQSPKTSTRIAEYIDTYQRAKITYLNIGGTGTYRLDYWMRDKDGNTTERNHLF